MKNLLKQLKTRVKIEHHKSQVQLLESIWLDELANHHREKTHWNREDTEESWDNVEELYKEMRMYKIEHREILKLDNDTRLAHSIVNDLVMTSNWHTNFIDYVQGDNSNLYNTACEFADKIESYES